MTSTAASECTSPTLPGGPASLSIFLGSSALLFVTSVALTIVGRTSMGMMGAMPMPGGWTMSMAWMRMPGQTWGRAWASFVLMWGAMMVAMMLPLLLPTLWRYRNAIAEAGERHVGRLTSIAGAAYFLVWAVVGTLAFPVGATISALLMQQPTLARRVPFAVALLVLSAGALQLTTWKAQRLACCAKASGGSSPPHDAGTAWRDGLRFGVACCRCCANLMAILLVAGVMDTGVMTLVTAAVAAERLSPNSQRTAKTVGAVVLAIGIVLLVRAG